MATERESESACTAIAVDGGAEQSHTAHFRNEIGVPRLIAILLVDSRTESRFGEITRSLLDQQLFLGQLGRQIQRVIAVEGDKVGVADVLLLGKETALWFEQVLGGAD